MTFKRKVQVAVDFFMTALLPFLMAYELVGEATHEWAGVVMFVLFILHHSLNWKWHKNLFMGRYTAVRALGTTINLLIFLLMLSLMVSGIIMSRHVFSFLGIKEGVSFARTIHLVSSYWCYVLICAHLGLHGSMLMGMTKKAFSGKKLSKAGNIALKAAAVLLAVYGIYAFVQRDIGSYMLLKTEFVFFDFSEPLAVFLTDYLAIMALFVILGHYTSRMLTKANGKHVNHKRVVPDGQIQKRK